MGILHQGIRKNNRPVVRKRTIEWGESGGKESAGSVGCRGEQHEGDMCEPVWCDGPCGCSGGLSGLADWPKGQGRQERTPEGRVRPWCMAPN